MPSRMDAGVCGRIVSDVAARCATQPVSAPTVPAPVPVPAAASTADALSAVAVSISLATAALGILTIAAAIGWLFYVRHRTKMEARREVEKVAPEHIRAYLDENVPGMIAEILAQISTTSVDRPSAGMSPEEQAEILNEDPR